MILLILKAVAIGFFASVGLGPVTIFVLKRGMSKGFNTAFLSGLACAIVDTIYGTIAFIGAGFIISMLEAYEGFIRIGIMILLLILAYFLWRSKLAREIQTDERSGKMIFGNMLSTFSLGLSNPFLIVVFLTIFSILPIANVEYDFATWPFVSVGLLIGTSLWWLLISIASSKFKNKLPQFLSENLNRVAGTLLFLLGIFSGISGVLLLMKS